MAENSWPFENADTTEVQFSKWANAMLESGAITGLDVTVSSGLTVNVGVGTGIVRGMFYENTTAKPLTVATAPVAGQTRLDAIVLKLDMAANTVTAVVKTGTANTSGGALPSLTQTDTTWEHLLRVITVPGAAAALVSGNIGAVQPAVGMRVIPYPAVPTGNPGAARALAIDMSTRRIYYWNNSTWAEVSVAAAWADITGKPTTFAPSTHNHTISQITDIANAVVADAAKVGGKKVNVQSGTPSSPSTNDLWFW